MCYIVWAYCKGVCKFWDLSQAFRKGHLLFLPFVNSKQNKFQNKVTGTLVGKPSNSYGLYTVRHRNGTCTSEYEYSQYELFTSLHVKMFNRLPMYAATRVLKIRKTHKRQTRIHIIAHKLIERVNVPVLGALRWATWIHAWLQIQTKKKLRVEEGRHSSVSYLVKAIPRSPSPVTTSWVTW